MAKRLVKLLRRTPLLGRRLIRVELERRYQAKFGRLPSLETPQSFNECILQRILHDRDPRLRIICDKLAVRDFIREHAGPEFLVPLLGVWKDPASIPWDALPERFVLKPNHSSGLIAIVRSHADRDPAALSAKAARWLRRDFFDQSLEWGYRGIPRRLMAEPLLAGTGGSPMIEAHAVTMHGKTALIRILTGEKFKPDRRENWFDAEGHALPINSTNPAGDFVLCADDARTIVALAERIAVGFSQIRVDVYLTDDGPKINELTPYHGAGMSRWNPPAWDEKLGQLWQAGLPKT